VSFKKSLIVLALGVGAWQNFALAAPPMNLENGQQSIVVRDANAWVEINKAAFESNIRHLQSSLGGNSKLCAVMKADAYGNGIGLLMPSVIALKVPCVAVASNEEARVVRAAGFSGQLVRVRAATLDEVQDALKYDIEELAGNLDFVKQAAVIASKYHRDLKVHLAINSGGMSRNGLDLSTDGGRSDALAIAKLSNVRIVAIMSHYAVEDKDDVRKGLALFNQQTDWFIKEARLKRSDITLHTANSYATLEVPEARLDMVRVGSALYGDTVPTYTEYKRIFEFKSKVASVNNYPMGNTVGYDHTATLSRDSRLANIPVGYSDGYRRAFTNRGHVLIDGHRVPVVGKVSMNTVMVDVTDFPDIKQADEVVLFGRQGGQEITKEEIVDVIGATFADIYTIWGVANPKFLVD
jgi:alanine racemase